MTRVIVGLTEENKRAKDKVNDYIAENPDMSMSEVRTWWMEKKKVEKALVRGMPENISVNGSGNFVSVMLFQIMLSDLMS
jgi:benzoyl-CoA reductase/2-hydroxyglutaryl-CoA dehydratase subunit BcrC/BadD/HgdB